MCVRFVFSVLWYFGRITRAITWQDSRFFPLPFHFHFIKDFVTDWENKGSMLLLKGDTAFKFWYFGRITRAITRPDSRKLYLSTSLYQSKVVLFTIFNFISILKKGSSTDREQEGSPCWGVRPLCIRFKVTVTANQCSVRKEGNAFTFCVHILFLLIVAGKQCRLGTRGRPMLWCKRDGAPVIK